ncbi:hypothetical protein TNCV_1870011 [Trichonephila clavipes]|nr:hypothetical protein TNCV_1870011 [Trichonephila clavipes]
MDALKLRRTPLRTAFTKAVNHLQEIIENYPVDKNAVKTAFEMLDAKGVKLKKIHEDILELMIETNCTQEAYNIEFEAIESKLLSLIFRLMSEVFLSKSLCSLLSVKSWILIPLLRRKALSLSFGLV